MKNEKLVVASFALVTDLSDGVPISSTSPRATPLKVVPVAGAVVKVIWSPVTVYDVLGS